MALTDDIKEMLKDSENELEQWVNFYRYLSWGLASGSFTITDILFFGSSQEKQNVIGKTLLQ